MKNRRLLLKILLPAAVVAVIAWLWQPGQPSPSIAVAPPVPAGVPDGGGGKPLPTVPAAPLPLAAAPEGVWADAAVSEGFSSWAERFLEAVDPSVREAMLDAGMALAQERRDRMRELIKSDPEQALREAVPYRLRKALPAQVLALLEEPVRGRGDLLVLGVVPMPGGEGAVDRPIWRHAEIGQRTYEAYVYGRRRHQVTTYNIPLHGIAVDNLLALHSDPVRVLEPEEAQDLMAAGKLDPDATCVVTGEPADALGEQTWVAMGDSIVSISRRAYAPLLAQRLVELEDNSRLAALDDGDYPTNPPPGTRVTFTQGTRTLVFMRVIFPDDPREPVTEAGAYAVMNQVNDWYVESSYNTLHIVSTVTPTLMLPHPKTYYSYFGPFAVLMDARTAAREAGYPFNEYDLDIVAHTTVEGFDWGGLGFVGARGTWLQSIAPSVAIHELGHNFGLLHANFWDTMPSFQGRLGLWDQPATRPGTQPPNPNAPAPNFPIDSDSTIGHDAVNWLGGDIAYGDLYDNMGSGGMNQFSALHKFQLNWLSERFIHTVSGSETNRLYAYDVPRLTPGRLYALRIRKDFERVYWAHFRQAIPSNPRLLSGVELHWEPWSGAAGTSQLIDTTPGTGPGRLDSSVVIGRTYADAQAELYLTPIAKGGTGDDRWVDVVVQRGPFPGNIPPTLSLRASSGIVTNGATVTFTATATDANGDQLAYNWEFSDASFGANAPVVTKTFTTEGYHVARCTVSDMKGGIRTGQLLVTVGSPTSYTMSGIVFDNLGQPVEGVRVHNGRQGDAYRWALTDSDGLYTMTDIIAGIYTNRAFLYGYKSLPLGFYQVSVDDANAPNLDHLANPFPRISIELESDLDESGGPAIFNISRTGDTTAEQPVIFTLHGTATAGVHYEAPATNMVLIPAGASSTQLVLPNVENNLGDGPRTLTATLLLITNDIRISTVITNTGTNQMILYVTNRLRMPGWELLTDNTERIWYQTYPIYVLGVAEATATVFDNDEPEVPRISLVVMDDAAVESGNDSATILFTRFANLDVEVTVRYSLGGDAINGVDYEELTGVIQMPAGVGVVPLTIVALDDLFAEGNETLTVNLLPDPTYDVGEGSGRVLILDDDLPMVTVNAPDSIAAEPGANRGRFLITRTGDISANVPVNYLVSGTALPGFDYDTLPGSIVIPSGQTSVTIDVIPVADTIQEGIETVVLLLSDSPLYNIGAPPSATVTIQDDELPTVTLTVPDDAAAEPNDTGLIRVTRTDPLDAALVVNLSVGGTAVPAADYSSLGNSVFFPPGVASVDIVVAPLDDKFNEEFPEDVIVALTAGPDYNLGSPISGTVTINDNDGGLPEVSFQARGASVPESIGMASFGVAISANPTEQNSPTIMEWRIVAGSASQGTDYTLISTGYLSYPHLAPPGSYGPPDLITNIDVVIQDDDLVEPTETIVLQLFDPELIVTNEVVQNDQTNYVISKIPTNAFLGPYRTYTLSIIDDDLNVVTVEATNTLARETGPTPSAFRIIRTGSTNHSQLVRYSVTGTATSPTDFNPLGTSVIIPGGTNAVLIPLIPADDSVEENAETVRLTIVSVPGGRAGNPDVAEIRIQDNDGTIQFVSTVYDAKENASPALLGVQRTGDTNLALTVDYAIVGGTATDGVDYRGTNGTLRFDPGVVLQEIALEIIDDDVVEQNETVQFLLSNPTGGVPLGGQTQATLIIHNDDTAFEFATNTFRANENGTNAVIVVNRIGVNGITSTVRLSTADGSATEGADYHGTNLVLNFRPGQSNLVLRLPLIDDILFEGDETVELTLSNPSPRTQLTSNSVSTLFIVDDESVLEFAKPEFEVREYAVFALVEVLRRGGTIHPVSVDYRTAPGTASNEVDYVSKSGTLSFAGETYVLLGDGSGRLEFRPGESNKIIQVEMIDDVLGEGDETFFVHLSNAVGPATGALPGSTVLGTRTNTVVKVLDNEAPGWVEYEFNPGSGANAPVLSVAVQTDLRIVFGGEFTQVDGVGLSRVGRLRPNGSLDTSFNPGVGADDAVHAVVSQPDGKVLIGGAFTTVDNTNRSRIARLNADGRLDLSFQPGTGASSLVRAIALQADGKVLIGGDFSQVGGLGRNRLARLNANGSLDTNFVAVADDSVYSIAVQPDGYIVVGGAFRTMNGVGRSGVARLTPAGSLDLSFNPGEGPNRAVRSVALQSNGQILLGGLFTSVGVAKFNYVARLNPDGSPDLDFDPGTGPDAPVYSVAVHAGGKVMIGGSFTNYNGMERNYYARLRSDGSLDSIFHVGSGANGPVRSVAFQPNSAIILGGEFTEIDGLSRPRIARIHGDEYSNVVGLEFSRATYTVSEEVGKADITVVRSGNTNSTVAIAYFTADGTARAGVDYEPASATLSFGRGEVRKTFSIEIVDDTEIEPDETVRLFLTNAPVNVELLGGGTALLVIKDNEKSIWFGSDSYEVDEGGTNAVITVVRLGPMSGDVSATFYTSDGTGMAGLDYEPVSNIVSFTSGMVTQTVLVPIIDDDVKEDTETVILNLADPVGDVQLGLSRAVLSIVDNEPGIGGVIAGFNPGMGPDNFVRSVAVQADGRIVLGGAFTNYNGVERNRVARIQGDGSLDETFNPGGGPGSLVTSVAALPDGRIVLGGWFTNLSGVAINRIARLNNDGGLDWNFNRVLSFDAAINHLTVRSNGKLVVGGGFSKPTHGLTQLRASGTLDTSFNPGNGANEQVHAAALQPDGKVVIAGAFTSFDGKVRSRVARLREDGLLDTKFEPTNVVEGTVYAVAVQRDGRILIAGSFGLNSPTNRPNLARLDGQTGSLDTTFDPGVGANETVFALGLQPNGKLIIGGDFTSVGGTNRIRYARLLPDGAVDYSFDPGLGANNTVYTLGVLTNKNVVIGGDFTMVSGQRRPGVALIRADDVDLVITGVLYEDEVIRVTIAANAGMAYTLEASSDFQTWTPLTTLTATGPELELADPDAGRYTRRFYRVREGQP